MQTFGLFWSTLTCLSSTHFLVYYYMPSAMVYQNWQKLGMALGLYKMQLHLATQNHKLESTSQQSRVAELRELLLFWIYPRFSHPSLPKNGLKLASESFRAPWMGQGPQKWTLFHDIHCCLQCLHCLNYLYCLHCLFILFKLLWTY